MISGRETWGAPEWIGYVLGKALRLALIVSIIVVTLRACGVSL